MFHASLALSDGPHYRSKRTMESARKTLWGGASVVPETVGLDPYDALYKVIMHVSINAYASVDSLNHGAIVRFLRQLNDFVRRCPLSHSAVLLRKMQTAIVPWIKDGELKFSRKRHGTEELRNVILDLWMSTTAAVSNLPRRDVTLVRALEVLISSGLSSRRMAVINETVNLWSRSFDLDADDCPPKIAKTLRKLRSQHQVQLASSFTKEADDSPISSPYPESDDTSLPASETPRHGRTQTYFTAVESSPVSGGRHDLRTLSAAATALSPRRIASSDFDSSPTPKPKTSLRVFDSFSGAGSTTPISPAPARGLLDANLSSSPTPASVPRSRVMMSDATEGSTPVTVRFMETNIAPTDPLSSPPAVEHISETAMCFQGAISVPGDVLASAEHEHGTDDNERLGDRRAPAGISRTEDASDFVNMEEDTLNSRLFSPTASIVNATEEPDQGSANDKPAVAQLFTELEAHVERTGRSTPAKTTMSEQQTTLSATEGDTSVSGPVQSEADVDAPLERLSSDNNEPEIFVDASQVPLPPSDDGANDNRVQRSENLPLESEPARNEERKAALHNTRGSLNVSRVTNSFGSTITRSASDTPTITAKNSDATPSSQIGTDSSQITARGTRKRKRGSQAGPRGTKQSKSESPLKQLMSSVFSQAPHRTDEDNDDEELHDCIVVASQDSGSPSSCSQRSITPSAKPVLNPSAPVPETPAAEPPAPQPRKRRSRASTAEEQAGVPVRDTPASKRPRLSSATPQAMVLSHVEIPTPGRRRDARPPRQSAAARSEGETTVSPDEGHDELGTEEGAGAAPAAAASTEGGVASRAEGVGTGAGERAPATPSRRILNPRGIVDRLRKILADCQQLVLGSQEEREMDDVLFEVRREVHEAGRRGRDG